MKKFWLSFWMVVLLMAPMNLCWADDALIVHDGTAGLEADVVSNLTSKLVTAGYTVIPNVGVPGGSLATYRQIWDVRFNNTTPLSAPDITAYVTYLNGGGSLFVMGENIGFAVRNNSIIALVQSAGGGTITTTNPNNNQTVQPPFTGPDPVATVTFLAAAGVPQPPGTGSYVTNGAGNIGASVVFPPGTLANASAGTLLLVFDVNFLDLTADAASQSFTNNLIAYLADPPPPVPSAAIPTLNEYGMMLFMLVLAAMAISRIRRRGSI